jgi:hypothetical protein
VEWLPLSAFVRADVYSPTMNLANTDVKDNFYGIIWNVNKDMRIALDHQTSQTGSAAQSGTLYVHMETKY